MRAVLLLTLVLVALLAPRVARADDTKWVGTPNVVVDSSSFALLAAGGIGAAVVTKRANGDPGEELAPWVVTGAVGALGLVFGSPIVHTARGHVDRAGASLGLRAVGGTLIVLSLVNLGSGHGPDALKVVLVGLAAAAFFTGVVFDDVVIARDTVSAANATSSALGSPLRVRSSYRLAIAF